MNAAGFKNTVQITCNFFHAFTKQLRFTLPIHVELNIPLLVGGVVHLVSVSPRTRNDSYVIQYLC